MLYCRKGGYNNGRKNHISVFNKNFKQAFSLSPKEFRQEGRDLVQETQDSDMDGLAAYLQDFKIRSEKTEIQGEKLQINTERGRPFIDPVLACMNAGMFVDLLEARVQEHVSMAIRNLGVKYIRGSNPFDPGLKVRSGHGTEQMNFDRIDIVLDFLLEQDALPIFELPERQKKMIVSIGSSKMLEEIKEDPVFLCLREWECALGALMEHLVDRYTAKEVSRWMFEPWYDVEGATGAGKISYFELYEHTPAIC